MFAENVCTQNKKNEIENREKGVVCRKIDFSPKKKQRKSFSHTEKKII